MDKASEETTNRRYGLVADRDVQAVLEFIGSSVPASRRASVAAAVSALASILWQEPQAGAIQPLRLVPVV
jgi:hypothetical protein